MLDRFVKTFFAVECTNHVVFAAQYIDDESIHLRVVLDDQDRAALLAIHRNRLDWRLRRLQLLKQCARRPHCDVLLPRSSYHASIRRSFEWKGHREQRSASHWRGLTNRPSMALHKFLDDSE